MLIIDGASLSLDDIVTVANGNEPVALSNDARVRRRSGACGGRSKAASDDAVYGVNTGFGSFAEVRIDADALDALQINLLRSHAAGVGPPLPAATVRAMMLLRANVLARGHSGIRAATIDALIALLNAQVHPVVPSRGSVGASGDLAPLAHLSLVLIGEGEAMCPARFVRALTHWPARACSRFVSGPRKGSR